MQEEGGEEGGTGGGGVDGPFNECTQPTIEEGGSLFLFLHGRLVADGHESGAGTNLGRLTTRISVFLTLLFFPTRQALGRRAGS